MNLMEATRCPYPLNDTQIFQPAGGYLICLVLGQPVAAPVSFFYIAEFVLWIFRITISWILMIANVQFTASGNLLEKWHINNANMGLNSE